MIEHLVDSIRHHHINAYDIAILTDAGMENCGLSAMQRQSRELLCRKAVHCGGNRHVDRQRCADPAGQDALPPPG